jgi:tRNA (guanine6-N2)-methyltransferase
LHPTLAAAAARLVPPNQADVVADPFCGSGTLLAERALVGPYKQMFGLDIDPRALKAAHTNLADFEHINLKQSDFAQISKLGPFDLIITNPPYGQRVGNVRQARSLHSQLDNLASKVLRPSGRLIVFRPPSFPSPTELEVVKRSQVDAGGLQVDIIVALKRC